MKIKFGGILEKKSGGCKPCGTKVVSKKVMATNKTYILPSGASKTFYIGRVEEVSEEDGRFLLGYTYKDGHGNTRNVFQEVK